MFSFELSGGDNGVSLKTIVSVGFQMNVHWVFGFRESFDLVLYLDFGVSLTFSKLSMISYYFDCL